MGRQGGRGGRGAKRRKTGFFRKKVQGGKPMFQEIEGGGIGWN